VSPPRQIPSYFEHLFDTPAQVVEPHDLDGGQKSPCYGASCAGGLISQASTSVSDAVLGPVLANPWRGHWRVAGPASSATTAIRPGSPTRRGATLTLMRASSGQTAAGGNSDVVQRMLSLSSIARLQRGAFVASSQVQIYASRTPRTAALAQSMATRGWMNHPTETPLPSGQTRQRLTTRPEELISMVSCAPITGRPAVEASVRSARV
jgi:hypothetical protein